MELKAIILLIQERKKVFFLVWGAVVFVVASYFFLKPASYNTIFSIEIGRHAIKQTPDYQYDQYYRLEADDKFASTVSRWLQDPAVTKAVLVKADEQVDIQSMRQLMKTFSGEKLSANYLQVRFSWGEKAVAQKIVLATREVLNNKTLLLNEEAGQSGWFKLIYGEPVTIKQAVIWPLVLFFSAIGGLLLALFSVLTLAYFSTTKQRKE